MPVTLSYYGGAVVVLTLLRIGGGQKGSPTRFSPVTSTNVEFSPQRFLTFNFNPIATLV